MLCTNRAYCATCKFWVQSCIKTSVWGFTSIHQAGLKTNVSGVCSMIKTWRSNVVLDLKVNRFNEVKV